MTDSDRLALLELSEVPGLGPVRIRILVGHFGSPTGVLKADLRELCRIDGFNLILGRLIRHRPRGDFAERQMEACAVHSARMITLWDDDYPPLLKKIYDPPAFLFATGAPEILSGDAIAVVGTRAPTTYGKEVARMIGEGLAKSAITVVSGFARGVDTLAHQATLEAGGKTIAVLGSGLDVVYPAENRRLVPKFAGNGAFLSEFPFGTKADAPNFPRRNRIISGLCHATVVVEAGHRSGALLTALDAVDQDRDLFAVPGRINDPKSEGCLDLIKDGAVPYRSITGLLDHLSPRLQNPPSAVQEVIRMDLSTEEVALRNLLSVEPKHIDELVRESGMDPSSLLTLLLELELKGAVRQLGGKHFVKI